jgi:hypothetical protein
MDKIQNEKRFLIIKYGSSFIYKEGYYRVPTTFTPNTWNFLSIFNKSNKINIGINKSMSENVRENRILITGNTVIDIKKLNKFRHNKLEAYNCIYLFNNSSDSD